MKNKKQLTLAGLERGTVYRDCDGPHGGDICVVLFEGDGQAQIASADQTEGNVYYEMIVGPTDAPDAWRVNEVLAARPMGQPSYTNIELVEHMARVMRREMGCEAFRDWVQDTMWRDARESVLEAFERVADAPSERSDIEAEMGRLFDEAQRLREKAHEARTDYASPSEALAQSYEVGADQAERELAELKQEYDAWRLRPDTGSQR